MPDITKCTNTECPKKESCYRYTCMSSELSQSFQKFELNEDGSCDFFEMNKSSYGLAVYGIDGEITN